ncbi:MAG TPA: FAD:protein FMN transferase [Candidatus Nanopelagicales bacterium]
MASLAMPPQRTGSGSAGDPNDLDAAQLAVAAWFEEVERALSPYRPDSDLCRWRRGELAESDSPLLAEVIDACAAITEVTDGAFHPYDRLGAYDPSGYVKGWAIDRGADLLAASGIHDACLGIGGDVQTIGRPAPDRPWRTAVVDPADEQRIVAMVAAPEAGPRFAVATSGEAQRGAHIWSAVGGPGVPGLVGEADGGRISSITVVGPDLRLADAYATAIFAGTLTESLAAAWAWLPGTGYAVLAVDAAGGVRMTPGMAQHLVAHG